MQKRQDLRLILRDARRGRALAGAALAGVMAWTGLAGHFWLAQPGNASAAHISALETPVPTTPGTANAAAPVLASTATPVPAPAAPVLPAPNSQVASAPGAQPPAAPLAPAPTSSTVKVTIGSTPYLYFVVKENGSFALARSQEDANDQPTGTPDVLVKFDDGFGESPTDTVLSLSLSPDDHYLAINGTHDDGEKLWMFDTRKLALKLEPLDVNGTFLNWFSDDSDRYLFRVTLPAGPLASADKEPGLWIGDAALDSIVNIDIDLPSIDVVDAQASPDGTQILYSTSRGLGQGSDIWTIDIRGQHRIHLMHLAAGAQRIAGMFRWSPDGKKIAYERLSDSPTPFLPASLWVMDRQGNNQRMLAQADGGHGFALRWSPDSSKIAYVARVNPSVTSADQSIQALQSSVNVVDVASGRVSQIASPAQTGMQINASPTWSANGKQLAFAAYNPLNPRLGGTVHYWSARVQVKGVHPSLAQAPAAITHVIAVG